MVLILMVPTRDPNKIGSTIYQIYTLKSKICSTFLRFLLGVVDTFFSLKDSNPDLDKVYKYGNRKCIFTDELKQLFKSLKSRCDIKKIIQHPALLKKCEKLKKIENIRDFYKENKRIIDPYLKFEKVAGIASWIKVAKANSFLATMFPANDEDSKRILQTNRDIRSYSGNTSSFIDFVRNCSKHLNRNIQISNGSGKHGDTLNRFQIEELIERVFPHSTHLSSISRTQTCGCRI